LSISISEVHFVKSARLPNQPEANHLGSVSSG
jgi:hypothetical protein